MRQVHEVLRLKWDQGLSDRKIAHSLGMSRPAVAEYIRRAQAAGLSWPVPATYDEGTLERLLFPGVSTRAPAPHLVPDWSTVHRELKRKGVTLFLLWQEYKAATPDGMQYSWFCHQQGLPMKVEPGLEHRAFIGDTRPRWVGDLRSSPGHTGPPFIG